MKKVIFDSLQSHRNGSQIMTVVTPTSFQSIKSNKTPSLTSQIEFPSFVRKKSLDSPLQKSSEVLSKSKDKAMTPYAQLLTYGSQAMRTFNHATQEIYSERFGRLDPADDDELGQYIVKLDGLEGGARVEIQKFLGAPLMHRLELMTGTDGQPQIILDNKVITPSSSSEQIRTASAIARVLAHRKIVA